MPVRLNTKLTVHDNPRTSRFPPDKPLLNQTDYYTRPAVVSDFPGPYDTFTTRQNYSDCPKTSRINTTRLTRPILLTDLIRTVLPLTDLTRNFSSADFPVLTSHP